MKKLKFKHQLIIGSVAGISLLLCCGAAFGNSSDEDYPVEPITWSSPSVVPTTEVSTPKVTTKPTPTTTVKPTSKAPKPKITEEEFDFQAEPEEEFYGSCKEARKAGAAPMYEGEPGYRPKLDRNSDGVACE